MPELPEVETIVRDLNKKIKGKIVKSVEVRVPKLIKLPHTKFVQLLVGQKIGSISRRAKMILIELGRKNFLLIHLKLTGQLVYRGKNGRLTFGGHAVNKSLENLPNKFTHIIFTFADGNHLFFNDLRKFGWMNIISKSDIEKLVHREFGVEPLGSEFTLPKFQEILNKKAKQPLKKVLLDQKNIAGIGNIYADEACFYAGVKPTRKVKGLSKKEAKKLWQGIKIVLGSAIKHRGTSSNTYVDVSGQPGGHVPFLKVYGRAGEKCKRHGCTGVVKRIKFNGRGTHYCEKCQN